MKDTIMYEIVLYFCLLIFWLKEVSDRLFNQFLVIFSNSPIHTLQKMFPFAW